MKSVLKKLTPHFFILNITALSIYFFVFFNLSIGISDEIMFSSPDSTSYLGVTDWLLYGYETENTSIRPILYPVILLIFYKSVGVFGLWGFQLLAWLISINLIFKSIIKITKHSIYGYIGALVFAFNFSLIAATLHGLTEIVTCLFLSILTYFIAKNIHRRYELFFIHGIILILALSTIIKPIFLIPLLLAIISLLFYIKKYRSSPIKILVLLLVLSPLIVQITIMKNKHDTFNVSTIGAETFDRYLLAMGIEQIDKIDRNASIIKAESFTRNEKLDFIIDNSIIYLKIVYSNSIGNIKSYPTFLDYPEGHKHPAFIKYMLELNETYFIIHVIFLFPLILLILLLFTKKMYKDLLIMIILACLNYYYLLMNSISYWQGDRLVLPIISVWTILYVLTFYYLRKLFIEYDAKHQRLF